MVDHGLLHFMPSELDIEKEFCPTSRFTIVKGHRYFKISGELNFENPTDYDRVGGEIKDVRLIFGFAFRHSGRVWKNTPRSLSLAMNYRALLALENSVQWETQVRNQQSYYSYTYGGYIYDCIHGGEKSLTLPLESLSEYVDRPHPKKILRVQAYDWLLNSGGIGSLSFMDRPSTFKLKTLEWAKPSKFGRGIVDLGTPASLRTAQQIGEFKKFLGDRVIVFNRVTFYFCSDATYQNVSKAFEYLQNSQAKWSFLVYSDDCVLKGPQGQYYNLDESRADMSCTDGLFELVFRCLELHPDEENGMWEQIMADIRVKSDTGSITLRPNFGYLQSGSTLTTLVNTMSYMVPAILANDVDDIEGIIECGRKFGYKYTVEKCDTFEDVQFLKISPVWTGENYHYIVNLGVILRASGVAKVKLPGRGDYYRRCLDHQSGLMNGLMSSFIYPPLERLNPKTTDKVLETGSIYDWYRAPVRVVLQRENFYARYHLDDTSIDEFERLVSEVGMGSSVNCQLVKTVLDRDYGLGLDI